MSDLQCPVRVVLVRVDGSWVPAGLGPLLARERVVGVWSGTRPEPEQAATALARAAGVPVVLRQALDGDGPSVASVLEEVADLHRGETVAVVLPAGADLTRLAGARGADGPVVRLEGDGDGWRLTP